MRRYTLLWVVSAIVALVWAGVHFGYTDNTYTYESTHIEQDVEEVITTPEYPEEWLKEAEAAAEAVIQKRKLEAERTELIDQRDAVQSRINEIEKELSL